MIVKEWILTMTVKIMETRYSEGGRSVAYRPWLNTTRHLKESFNLNHPDVREELWSQDLVTDGRTCGKCRLAPLVK